MTKSRLVGAVLWTFLLTTSPAVATLRVTLENPQSEASGINLVSGWAFSTLGAAVTVRPRVDGATQDIVIPCCGPRADVQVGEPGAPLSTGFGALINYGNLSSPGTHTIGVEVSAAGETPVTVERAVVIAKPGGRSGEPAQLFSFLNDLDPTGANVALDSATEELIVTPVTVQDSGAGGTRRSTIRLRWLKNSQSFGIVRAASDRRFAGVQVIFTAKCASCHIGGGSVLPASMNLSNADSSFQNLVAVKSAEASSLFLINPGDDDASYLYQKVIPNPTIAIQGERMPLGCAGNSCLSQGEIDTIENWISGGAAPPQ